MAKCREGLWRQAPALIEENPEASVEKEVIVEKLSHRAQSA